jgi:signal transduction histidine kinase
MTREDTMNTEPHVKADAVEVLIIEDSATQALELQLILERHGYRVTANSNAEQALATLQTFQPTLVISDINMPGMDGYQLCQKIKNDPALKDIPVMLLTSLSAPKDIIRGLECGADNFVVKPYEEHFLLSRIHFILANQELHTTAGAEMGISIYFGGQKYFITADRLQILNLLLTTYETAIQRNQELTEARQALELQKQVLARSNTELESSQRNLQASLAELQKMHADLRAVQLQLVEAEKMRTIGRLAAGVAHEVKNPLAILMRGLDFLSQSLEQPDASLTTILKDMQDAIQRANAVIHGLLDFAAPNQLEAQPEDLNLLVHQALFFVKHPLTEHCIHTDLALTPDLPLCRLDRQKLTEVLVNLFDNAIQAMSKGGTLTVRTAAKTLTGIGANIGGNMIDRFQIGDRVAVVEIEDTGRGIPADKLDKIFDPFFTTKPAGQGTGLGLAICKTIVELHRGSIEIRNRDGGGILVTLMFKVEEAAHEATVHG